MTITLSDRDDRPTWFPVAGSQPLTYVAKHRGRPIAIIEVLPHAGCCVTSSRGDEIGRFSSLTDVQSALVGWIGTRSHHEAERLRA